VWDEVSYEHSSVCCQVLVVVASVALKLMVFRFEEVLVSSSLSSPDTNAYCGPNTLATLVVTWLMRLRTWTIGLSKEVSIVGIR
jgi:hypothetical protein